MSNASATCISWREQVKFYEMMMKFAMFQLHVYHGEKKVKFYEMMMKFALCYTNTFSGIFIVLAR